MNTTQPTLEPSHTPDIGALIAAHAQRAARLQQAMDMILLASLKRGVEQQA